MKKLLALFLALVMLFSIAACGNNDNPDPDKDDPGVSQEDDKGDENVDVENSDDHTTDDANNSEIQNTPANQWNDSKYTNYTGGIEEPSFNYTIKGVLMDQLTINAEATEDEVSAWKQSLLDAGFEEYREGEQWGIKNDSVNIQMNGFVNGIAYIYIGLE